MSEFTDLLLSIFDPAQALLFIGLALIDLFQTRYLSDRLEGVEGRVRRLEDVFIEADGGEPDERENSR